MNWVPNVLTDLATQRAGIWSSRFNASFQPPAANKLDVRYPSPDKSGTGEFNIPGLLDPTFASWAPIWNRQATTFRTPEQAKLNPSMIVPEPMAWLKATLSLTDSQIPTTFGHDTSVTIFRKVFPRIGYEDTSWVTSIAVQPIAAQSGIFSSQQASFRTPDAPKLDPRLIQSWQDISFQGAGAGASIAQYLPPILEQTSSFRTASGPAIDPRLQQFAARKFGIPFNPALFQSAFDQTQHAASYRTLDLDRAMLRYSEWSTFPIAPSPTSFQYPAILQLMGSFRTADKPQLDVRYSPSQPSTGWEVFNLDPLLKIWTPAFAQLMNSYRSTAGPVLDARGIHYDQFGWLDSALGLTDPPKRKLTDHRLPIMLCGR